MTSDRYLINTTKCRMPFSDPFSSDAIEMLEVIQLKKCCNQEDLFSLQYNVTEQQYRLNVNTRVLLELNPVVTKFSCNYNEILKTNETELYITVSPRYFQQDAIINRNISGIVAQCHELYNPWNIMQQHAFPLVQVPGKTRHAETHPFNRKPSVIILGLTGVSRLNFQRSMSKSWRFLQQPGWIEMLGYNKVDNTFLGNLCGIFAGLTSKQKCDSKFAAIWRAYKAAGYATAFAEDTLTSSLPLRFFHDFNVLPFMKTISENMDIFWRFGMEYCIGRRLSIDYLFDFCQQFSQRFVEELDQPAFGVFWSSTFTREVYYGATGLDDQFLSQLKLMSEHHIFENAIVMVVSDQGQQIGELVSLPDGFLEQRLPMLHIHLPKWFRATYPNFHNNMLANSNNLTSPFDLHQTLYHILHLNANTPEELRSPEPSTYDGKKCQAQSLFHQIPLDRGCVEACIDKKFCACNEFVPLKSHRVAFFFVTKFVRQLNIWLLKHKFHLFCQRLRVKDIVFVENKFESEPDTFRIRINVDPEPGLLEAIVHFDKEKQTFEKVELQNITPLHNFNIFSECVKNVIAKKFCFCYPEELTPTMLEWKNITLDASSKEKK
ncbi:hypothetical protein KR018_006725 [Drosophila ironensis]|nr:hypothetical protein KR018_006725 [Drosophila ironensis]